MAGEQVQNQRTNCMIMLLAFWCCMLTIYLYIRGVNVLGVCNSTLLGFLQEEAVELTDLASPKRTSPHFNLTDLAAGKLLLNVSS